VKGINFGSKEGPVTGPRKRVKNVSSGLVQCGKFHDWGGDY